MLDDLTELAKRKYVAPNFLAGIHIGLGDNDRAMEYLEQSWEESILTGLSIFISIRAWTICGVTLVSRTC